MSTERQICFAELGLAERDGEALRQAITEHPILLERPIFVMGDRAVARPSAARLRELLSRPTSPPRDPRRP